MHSKSNTSSGPAWFSASSSTTSSGSLKSCGYSLPSSDPSRPSTCYSGRLQNFPHSRLDIQVCSAVIIEGLSDPDRLFAHYLQVVRVRRGRDHRRCHGPCQNEVVPRSIPCLLYPASCPPYPRIQVLTSSCGALQGEKLELAVRTGLYAK